MRVVSNTATSLDGRINSREGAFTTLGTARDHERMSLLRSRADAVLVGAATFRNWPHPALPEGKDLTSLGAPIWNVVVSRSLRVPLTGTFLGERRIRPLFIAPAASVPEGFPAEVEAWPGPDPSVPVPFILDALERRGVRNLLVEAGGDLLFQFLAANAIDEMFVTLCPLVIGGRAPSLADGPGFDYRDLRRLRLLSSEAVGDEVFLHYAVEGRAPPG